jgi:ATP-binding cassette subfamily F protein 3
MPWSGWKPGCKRYEGTMIVISHDREFLDAVTNVTMHIDNAQITRYGGNYSKFEDLRAEQLELQQASFSKQQEKIAHLKKFIDRFKAKASKAKQAQSRVKALDRMEKIAPVLADAEFTFEFKEPTKPAQPDAGHQRRIVWLPQRRRCQETTILRQVSRSRAGRPAHRHSGRQRPGQVHAGQDHCPRPWRRWPAP